MSEAATVWQPQLSNEGEYSSTGNINIDLEDGVTDIVMEDGSTNIVVEDSSFTPIPATVFTFNPGT